MKKSIFTIALTLCASFACAQNSAFYKAESLEQKGELEEAAKVLEEALTNPKTTKLAQMYNKAGSVQAKIFNPELLKAAQGYPFDTAKFIAALDKSVTYYTKSHEADVAPDEKGRVKPKFVEDNHNMLHNMLVYYNYAAMFAYANEDYLKSRELFQKYIMLPTNPVFSKEETDSIYEANRKDYSQAAFNVTMLNYKAKDWDAVIKSADIALKDTLGLNDLYIMKCQAYLEKGDSASWLNTLKEAVTKVENNPNFAQNLLYYYVSNEKTAEAEAMAADLIHKSPDSKQAWYMKGCVDLNMKKDFPAAREAFQKALDIEPGFVEANINMAVSYINEVIDRKNKNEYCLDKQNVKQYNADIDKMRAFYEKARPYYEKVRELIPDQPRKWAAALQQIYSNLGMKAQADEMDAILQAANQG